MADVLHYSGKAPLERALGRHPRPSLAPHGASTPRFSGRICPQPVRGAWPCPSSSFNCIRFLPFTAPPSPLPPDCNSKEHLCRKHSSSFAPVARSYATARQLSRSAPHPRRRSPLYPPKKHTKKNNSKAPLSQPFAEINSALHKTLFPSTPRYLRVYVHRKSQDLRYGYSSPRRWVFPQAEAPRRRGSGFSPLHAPSLIAPRRRQSSPLSEDPASQTQQHPHVIPSLAVLTCLFLTDPFAEADEDTGETKQTQNYIHIRIQRTCPISAPGRNVPDPSPHVMSMTGQPTRLDILLC